MKTKKNFLKKLTAGILGFVMTLGVGAAGYAANAGETKAADATLTFDKMGADLGSTSGSGTVTVNNYEFNYGNGKKQGDSMFLTSGSGYIANKTAIPGSISSIVVYANSGASGTCVYHVKFGTSAFSAYTTSGTSSSTIAGGSNKEFSNSSVSGATYFIISCASKNGQVLKIDVKYSESGGGTIPVTSISLSQSSLSLSEGATQTLTATVLPADATDKTVTWSTDKPSVATVDNGVVTAVAAGSATITATAGDESATCSVTVTSGGGGGGTGSVYTLILTDTGITGTSYDGGEERTWEKNSITFGGKAFCEYSTDKTKFQFQKSNGVVYNITEFSEPIDNIVINQNAAVGWTMRGGSTERLVISDKATYTVNGTVVTGPEKSTSMKWVFPADKDYTFFGVRLGSDGAAYVSSIVITLRAPLPKHSVAYEAGEGGSGTAPTQADVAEGKTFTVAANTFSRTGYNFNGWKDDNGETYGAGSTYTMSTSDVTFTAQWTATTPNAVFNANNGKWSDQSTSQTVQQTFDKKFILPTTNPSRTGYTFNGWFTASSDGTQITTNTDVKITSQTTYYAQWTAQSYNVTFNSGDGSWTGGATTQVISETYDAKYSLPVTNPSKDHYNFSGWYTDVSAGNEITSNTTVQITAVQTLYAHYTIQSHTVTYNGNGGTVDKASDTVQYGKDVDLTVGATNPGFTLLGWALSSDAAVGLNSLTMEDSNITLYAVWKEDERTYAFNAYANDGVTSEPYHIGDYRNGADITMPYFEDLHISRSGYTALGWSTTSTGEVEYDEGDAAKMGDSALNIYVVWQKHLDEKPTLTLSGSTSMWVGKNQTLTINYTSGAETLNVSASPAGVVSLTQTADTGSVRTYTVTAIAAGEVTITAGDSFYSDSVTITSTRDYLDKVIISGSLPSGTYYEGDALSISTAITNLSISGKNKSGDSVTISKNNATWTFADGSSSVTLATGMTKVTVVAEYEDVESNELELPITVTANVMESLTVNYTGGQPVLGTTFSFAGSITANMSNGAHPSVNLSDVTIGAVDKFSLESQTITVTHKTTGATGTFIVQYKAKQIETQISWQKVTATQTDWSGEYLLAYEDNSGSTSKTLFWTGVDAGQCHVDVNTPSDYKLSSIPNGAHSIIVDTMDGGYSIKVNGGDNDNKYIGQSSYANGMSFNDSEQLNTISLDNNGNAVICGTGSTTDTSGNTTYVQMKYNKATGTSNERFRYYKSGQENVLLYKKVETPIGQPSVIKIDASLKAGKTFSEGDSISASDFNVSALYDTGTTGDVTATSVTPTKLGPGDNTITVNYNSFSVTVVVPAAEIAHLDHIAVVDGTGQRSFERLDDFDSTGLEVMAYYSNIDKTKFPDHKVTNFDIDSTAVDMSKTGTYTVGVSYIENGVTRSTSYDITITPKTSTYVTIEGDGIQGSGGSYTLTSPVQNTVDLTVDFDGDEELSVSTESSFLSYVNGQLIINSDTKTSETGSITFSAGDVSATLTVTVTAAETIQLISDAHVAGFIGEDLDVEIALGNVVSATWTLPSAGDGFTVKTTSKDNTGFVGTISVSEECTNKEAVFSVVTGKGETLSVSVYVSAQFDAIKSISATCSKSYVAGQDTFSPSDLTVTYERLSGATGTLTSSEFTVTGAPTGKLARTSYNLTITSNEGSKTCNCTISANMPSGLNVVTAHTEEIPGQTTVSWSLLSNKSQLGANEKIYLYESSKGYVTGVNGSDATVSNTASDRIEFTIEIVNATDGTFKLKSTSGTSNGKYISNLADNKFNIAASQNDGAVFQISSDTEGLIYYTDSKSATRMLAVNGSYLRCYKTGNSSYSYFSAYISKTTTGQPTTKTTYTNHESMSGTMFDFINRWGGTELTAGNWGDIFGSDEYKALTATDKEWFAAGVVSGTDATAGYLESCELFADFITKYDEVLATNDGLTNYLNRQPVEAYTITIDYNHDGQTSTVKALAGEYNLPEAPTYDGYVFQGWLVNGETKAAGSPITVSENMTITAQWVQGITFSSEFGFKFTGLDITRFQLIFNGTCPDDAEQYGFLYTKSDIDLTSLTAEQIEAGVTGVGQVTGKNQAVLGTSYGNTEVSVVFYYIDGDGQVHYSEVITTSFDEMAQNYDLDQITDPYARLCLEYYLANFAE